MGLEPMNINLRKLTPFSCNLRHSVLFLIACLKASFLRFFIWNIPKGNLPYTLNSRPSVLSPIFGRMHPL